MNKLVEVVVTEGGLTSKLAQQLLYDYTNSAIVTNVNPSVLSVLGKLSRSNLSLNFDLFKKN